MRARLAISVLGEGVALDELPARQAPRTFALAPIRTRVGLERMRDRTPDGVCPFCLDPLPPRRTKPHRHCGDVVCLRAYNRTYQRDRRRGLLVAQQRTVGR